MKIVVYAICKNEAQFVSRWIKSMSEADQIVVLDTGSTDDTVQRLRTLGAQVTVETICPWRFDVARNRSLELVDPDADICVCTDLDEVFHPGWRKALESAWIPGTTQATYRYTWSFRPDGGEGVVFWYEKIHARHGYRWVHPVHEVLEWMGPGQPGLKVSAEGVQLDHHPDPKKSRAQYLPLLELAVAEAPQDDRSVHYLGREYLFHSRWDDCIRTLTQHLTMPSATWADERAASMRFIAQSYEHKGTARGGASLVPAGSGGSSPSAGTLGGAGPAALHPGGVGWGTLLYPKSAGHCGTSPHLHLRSSGLGSSALRPALPGLLPHRPTSAGPGGCPGGSRSGAPGRAAPGQREAAGVSVLNLYAGPKRWYTLQEQGGIPMALRLATPMDAPALVGIYGQYIHTPITFEYELPSPREFQDRITHTLEDYPYLVWEENGTPVGYAYAHRFKERAAYQWGAELSVYVARATPSQKVGRRLYGALMELLAIQGVRTVYGIVTVPNEKSEGLHRSMGFQDAGICRNTGYVDGAWRDVQTFEKAIGPYDLEPVPITPFPQLSTELVQRALAKWQ